MSGSQAFTLYILGCIVGFVLGYFAGKVEK